MEQYIDHWHNLKQEEYKTTIMWKIYCKNVDWRSRLTTIKSSELRKTISQIGWNHHSTGKSEHIDPMVQTKYMTC